MSDPFHHMLATKGTCVLDGGLASELEARGADLSDRLWSARLLADDPELIRQVHLDYFAAGADIAISASYQASFEGFADRGIERDRAAGLMRRSVELARSAAVEHRERHPGSTPIVAASVGPYGAMLADGSEYVGRYGLTVRQLRDFHRPRLEALLDAAPDLLAVETIPSIEEAEAIVTLLEELPAARAWISFSCRDGERINDGTPFADAVKLAASSGRVVAVGLNCTPARFVTELIDRAIKVPLPVPLVVYPNEGAVWNAATKAWMLGPDPRPDFGTLAVTWREAGATIIGGCCGTRPADIEAIVASARTSP